MSDDSTRDGVDGDGSGSEPSAMPGGLDMPSYKVGESLTDGFSIAPIVIEPIRVDPLEFADPSPIVDLPSVPDPVVEDSVAAPVEETLPEVAVPVLGDVPVESQAIPEPVNVAVDRVDEVGVAGTSEVLPASEVLDGSGFDSANVASRERLVLRDGRYVIEHTLTDGSVWEEPSFPGSDAPVVVGDDSVQKPKTGGCMKAFLFAVIVLFLFPFLLIGCSVLTGVFETVGGAGPVDSTVEGTSNPNRVPAGYQGQMIPANVSSVWPSANRSSPETSTEEVEYGMEDLGWWLEKQAWQAGRWPQDTDVTGIDFDSLLPYVGDSTIMVSYQATSKQTVWDTGSVADYLLCGFSEEAPETVLYSSLLARTTGDGFVKVPAGAVRCAETSSNDGEWYWHPWNAVFAWPPDALPER